MAKKNSSLPSKTERHKMYLPLILQGKGYRKIARELGFNTNTVKSDLHQLKKQAQEHTPPSIPGENGNPPPHITPHSTPGVVFDWDKALDNAGMVVDKLVREGLESRDDKMFRWAVAMLFKGAQAKMGVLRIQNTLNVGVVVYSELDDGQKDNVRREVLQELFREYREAGVCQMCGQPKPIDVDPVEVK